MLKTAEGQTNAVFACVGSALQHAQQFEAEVAGLLLACAKLGATPPSLEQLECLDRRLQRQTLGTMLKRWSEQATIDDNSHAKVLTDALQSRNFLVHRYFLERGSELANQAGRRRLLEELVAIEAQLEKATTLARAMAIVLDQVANGTRSADMGGKALFTITIATRDDL